MTIRSHPGTISTRVRAALVAMLSMALVVVAGCGTGDDAVVQGDTFQFVSPGGKTVITYDPLATRLADNVARMKANGVTIDTKPPADVMEALRAAAASSLTDWLARAGPEAQQVYETYRSSGVAFLGINFRDERQDAKDYITNQKLAYESIYDYPGRTLVRLTTPTSVVPTTVVLDRDHRAAAVYLRTVSAEELGALVKRLAAEPYSGPSASAPPSTLQPSVPS